MAKSSDNSAMRSGHIDTSIIYDTHVQVKKSWRHTDRQIQK